MRDLRTYFLDAHSGFIAHDESLVREQTVGAGNGILGQRKKLSTSQAGGVFQAYDRLRPAEIITLDLRYDIERFIGLLLGGVVWASSDVASDADNEWSDPAVVDGHAYIGFTYDYLANPLGLARRGWEERPDFQHRQFRAGRQECVLRSSAVRTGRTRCGCLWRGRGRPTDRVGRYRGPRVDAWRDVPLRPAAYRHAAAQQLLVNFGTVELHAGRVVQNRAGGGGARMRAELHVGSPGTWKSG